MLLRCDVHAFRLGGENLSVAQNTYAVSWFQGRELNMVFGLQLSFARVVLIFYHRSAAVVEEEDGKNKM